MATATQVLRHEHEAIIKMVDVTEQTANRLKTGEPVRGEILDNLLEFFRLFVDQLSPWEEMGAGTHERLHAMMNKLLQEMGDGDCGDWS